MIHFLIDYENVNYRGLDGFEYLTEDDHITIFYSDSCRVMEQNKLKQLWEVGCEVELVKLVNQRKNGLDFYIASRVGEIFATDKITNIAIVSTDSGFKALRDYWINRITPTNRLVINDTVYSCIISSAETYARKIPIQNAYKKLDMESVYETWKEIRLLTANLHDLFSGTEYEHMIPDMVKVIRNSSHQRDAYLNSLKTFGRKTGIIVYNSIKNNELLKPVC